LEKLKNIHIDIGFVPLDPRQESNAYKGLETFMEYTDTDMVFPMHFWGEYDIIKMFIKKNHIYKNKIKVIKNKGQVFKI
ncbi:MAG: MBL fold metallo-hydrolase, partial [Lachnospiraceae bacterium]